MADTIDIAKKLVELVRASKNLEAVDTLYADDIVSVEPVAMGGHPRDMHGKAAIRKKNQWWLEHHKVHSMTINGPWPHEDRFIVHYQLDVTADAGPMANQRFKMEEAALYTVKDGKIVKEEFFYALCK